MWVCIYIYYVCVCIYMHIYRERKRDLPCLDRERQSRASYPARKARPYKKKETKK